MEVGENRSQNVAVRTLLYQRCTATSLTTLDLVSDAYVEVASTLSERRNDCHPNGPS